LELDPIVSVQVVVVVAASRRQEYHIRRMGWEQALEQAR
jgi:hypothetical protein